MGTTTRWGRRAVPLGIAALALSCGLFQEPAPVTLDLPSCSGTDMACIQADLSIEDASQKVIPLTTIPAGTVQPSQLAAGKGVPVATDIYSTTLAFIVWDYCIEATLTFTDPNGATIGGCFHVRPKTQLPGSFGTFPMVAIPSVPDGQTKGTLSIWICPSFMPSDGDADFAIDMYPVAAVTPGREAVAELLGGGPVAVGAPISFDAQVAAPSSGGSSSGSGSGSSSGSSGCAPGDLLCSTLSCTPLGSGGASSYCLSASEYTGATGQPLPTACAASGTRGCIGMSGMAQGALVAPCCPGLTCRDSATCGDSSNAAGGTCLP